MSWWLAVMSHPIVQDGTQAGIKMPWWLATMARCLYKTQELRHQDTMVASFHIASLKRSRDSRIKVLYYDG